MCIPTSHLCIRRNLSLRLAPGTLLNQCRSHKPRNTHTPTRYRRDEAPTGTQVSALEGHSSAVNSSTSLVDCCATFPRAMSCLRSELYRSNWFLAIRGPYCGLVQKEWVSPENVYPSGFLKSQPVWFNTAYMVPSGPSSSDFAIVATRFSTLQALHTQARNKRGARTATSESPDSGH